MSSARLGDAVVQGRFWSLTSLHELLHGNQPFRSSRSPADNLGLENLRERNVGYLSASWTSGQPEICFRSVYIAF